MENINSKTCKTCNIVKNIHEFKFRKDTNKYREDCTKCINKKSKDKRLEKLKIIDYNKAINIINVGIKRENILNNCPDNHKWCNQCNKYKHKNEYSKYNYENFKLSVCRDCANDNSIQRNRKLKLKAIEYLGGKCKRCKITGHYSIFDFHHKIPNEKEFNWDKARKKTFEKIINELDKCDLLCKNCHQIIHTKLNNDGTLNTEYIES